MVYDCVCTENNSKVLNIKSIKISGRWCASYSNLIFIYGKQVYAVPLVYIISVVIHTSILNNIKKERDSELGYLY